jgi:MarR family transcriptional regulator, 2-MHQ and catechol-resistance regulon repressor
VPTRFQGDASEVLALDTLIKLLRATSTIGARLYVPLQRDHGITEGQLGVLEALLHLGPMTQTQLCGKLLTSGSNLTTVLDNLERRGWVRRERDTADRRVQNVHLTNEGRSLIEEVFPGHARRVAELFAALDEDEQRQLGDLCRKLGRSVAER